MVVVTQIEVATDGGDAPPTKMPDEPGDSGERKDTGCQVTWTIDESGESTVTIGRPPAFNRPIDQSPLRHDDGTIEFRHDLNTPDAVSRTFMSRAENIRFDRTLQALVLAPKVGRGGQSPQANFAYSKLTRARSPFFPMLHFPFGIRAVLSRTYRLTLSTRRSIHSASEAKPSR